MKGRFKLKINGESPRSLFLAFVLAKFKCDVYLYDFFINSNSKKDNQIFLFSNSTKNLLSKFNIWNEIEEVSYSFSSLSIKDNLVSEQLLLQTENFSKKYLNTIGWTASYSDIKNLLINKLINSDNVHIISKSHLTDESLIFDYEFNFKSYNRTINLSNFPLSIFKRINEQILIFNVHLRGHVTKRLYQINTTEGLLVFTPLNKNLYQIIWNNPSYRIKETSLHSKSLFLDNLTTLLPKEFIIDQIIGDVNFMSISNMYSTCLIKNKSIYINENKFKSNTLYDLNFDIIINIILKIYNLLENNEHRSKIFINKSKFFNLLGIYVGIINLNISNSLFNLFNVNNKFSLFVRKLLFNLFKRRNFKKILFLRKNNYLDLIKLIR